MNTLMTTASLGSMALIGWHHVAWPVLMKAMTRGAERSVPPRPLAETELPMVTVVMPAYNEQRYIAAKIRNLAAQDYPAERLQVVIACDGCSDATVAIARRTLAEPACAGLRASVIDHPHNRGKIATLNEAIAAVTTEIVVLSDVSAMLPPDAVRRAAAHFADPKLGAVGGAYRLAKAGSAGEATYWRYQTAVKRAEAAMGAPLGLHGAFYALRRTAWAPLPADTINDDFILPMEIFGRGWRVAYDETFIAWEAEVASEQTDIRRRRRIAAGNAQQLVRLLWLLHPRHGGVALAFGSGKALRVLMPFMIVLSVISSVLLSEDSVFFALTALLQLAGLGCAAASAMIGPGAPRLLAVAKYAVAGHLASLIGVTRYCAHLDRTPWRRAAIA
jgi:cellulose synthase/poly-beta-1,6-N-acetylglucosamine synthase-like glycosyltransferase